MRRGADVARSQKASWMIYSMTAATTPDERDELRRIENILFDDGARTDGERNDVEIVFNAVKYMAILVTNDGGSRRQPGGILGNAVALQREFGVRVMRDTEAVAYVEEKIMNRDEIARIVAHHSGLSLPDWIGKD